MSTTEPQRTTPAEPKTATPVEGQIRTANSSTLLGAGMATTHTNRSVSSHSQPGPGAERSNTGQSIIPDRANILKTKAAKCVLIGNSQIEDINPDRFSEKTNLIKVKQYTIKEANEWVNSRNIMPYRDSQYVTIHEITNDVKNDSIDTIVKNMKTLINSVKNQFDKPKILISLGTPRDDGLQDKVSGVNSAIRDIFSNDQQVKTCHHQNLSERGRINAKFYKGDKYHLNDTGTRILAANLRYSIEGKRGMRDEQGQVANKQQPAAYSAGSRIRNPYSSSTRVKIPYDKASYGSSQKDSHQSRNTTLYDGHDLPQQDVHQTGVKTRYDSHQGHYVPVQGHRPVQNLTRQNNHAAPNFPRYDNHQVRNVQEYYNHQTLNSPIYESHRSDRPQTGITMRVVPNVSGNDSHTSKYEADNYQEYVNHQGLKDSHRNDSRHPPNIITAVQNVQRCDSHPALTEQGRNFYQEYDNYQRLNSENRWNDSCQPQDNRRQPQDNRRQQDNSHQKQDNSHQQQDNRQYDGHHVHENLTRYRQFNPFTDNNPRMQQQPQNGTYVRSF